MRRLSIVMNFSREYMWSRPLKKFKVWKSIHTYHWRRHVMRRRNESKATFTSRMWMEYNHKGDLWTHTLNSWELSQTYSYISTKDEDQCTLTYTDSMDYPWWITKHYIKRRTPYKFGSEHILFLSLSLSQWISSQLFTHKPSIPFQLIVLYMA